MDEIDELLLKIARFIRGKRNNYKYSRCGVHNGYTYKCIREPIGKCVTCLICEVEHVLHGISYYACGSYVYNGGELISIDNINYKEVPELTDEDINEFTEMLNELHKLCEQRRKDIDKYFDDKYKFLLNRINYRNPEIVLNDIIEFLKRHCSNGAKCDRHGNFVYKMEFGDNLCLACYVEDLLGFETTNTNIYDIEAPEIDENIEEEFMELCSELIESLQKDKLSKLNIFLEGIRNDM